MPKSSRRSRTIVGRSILLAAASVALHPNAGHAGIVEFIGRNFPAAGNMQVPFEVIGGPSQFLMGTYSSSGGVMPGGIMVPAGGMDSVLQILNSGGTVIAQHDDLNGASNRDSEIRSSSYVGAARSIALIASPLAAGTYQARLSRFAVGGNNWSLSIANNNGVFVVRNPVLAAGQLIDRVQIKASGRLELSGGALAVTELISTDTGGTLTLDNNAKLASTLHINGNVVHGKAAITGSEILLGNISGSIARYYMTDPAATIDVGSIGMGYGSMTTSEFFHDAGNAVTSFVILGSAAASSDTARYRIRGGTLDAGYITADASSVLDIQGGTVRIAQSAPSDFKLGTTLLWSSGTLEFLDGTTPIDLRKFLGDAPSLTPGRRLALNSSSSWNTLLTLNGGTLAVDAIDPAAPLAWNTGTIEFTDAVTFGAGQWGGPLVTLSSGKTITGSTATISSSGAILIQPGGRLAMSSITNAGNLILGGAGAVVDATQILNTGNISGSGLIRAVLANETLGTIALAASDALRVDGIVTNAGRISLTGGSLTGNVITNYAGGTISGRGTIAGPFNNSGTASFSGGTSDLIGNVTNQATGKIIATGAGTLTVHGALTNTAGSEFRVSANSHAVFLGNVNGLGAFTGVGTKYFEGGTTGGALTSGGVSVVEATGSLTAGGIRESALTLRGDAALLSGSITSRVNTLAFEGGTLDLGDNRLVLDYAATSPAADIRSAIIDGDLFSTAAFADRRTIGYADNTELGLATFGSLAVDSTSVLIRWTLRGDSNLDGTVNFADLVRLAQNYNGTGREWLEGDFNYDGRVNFADLVSLAQNYNGTLAAPLSADATFAADWALAQTFIPEPTTAAATLALATIARRRRR